MCVVLVSIWYSGCLTGMTNVVSAFQSAGLNMAFRLVVSVALRPHDDQRGFNMAFRRVVSVALRNEDDQRGLTGMTSVVSACHSS